MGCSASTHQVRPFEQDLMAAVYISRMAPQFLWDCNSIAALGRFANANNRQMGVTGYLVVATPFFIQRLEGPRATLTPLLQAIERDPRHKDLIFVERRRVARRSYAKWEVLQSLHPMPSDDLNLEAFAIILQTLSRGVALAKKAIHPTLFDSLLSRTEHGLRDETFQAFVVTVSLGHTVIHRSSDGHGSVANAPVICAVVTYLRQNICSLNPEGQGLVTMFGGTAIQVAVRAAPDGHNVPNKVVRACAELFKWGSVLPGADLGISIEMGPVAVRHLQRGWDLRGRYMCGAPFEDGLQSARWLHDTSYSVVMCEALLRALNPEFVTTAVQVGTRHMWAVEVSSPRAQFVAGTRLEAKMALCRDTAVTLVTQQEAWTGALGSVDELFRNDTYETGEDVAQEWMYQLEALAKQHAKSRRCRKHLYAPDQAHETLDVPMLGIPCSTVQSNPSLLDSEACDAPPPDAAPLLNIIYISTVTRALTPAQLAELGRRASSHNAVCGITGFLLYTRPFFLQYMEGPVEEVKALFTKLCRDPRHGSITTLTSRIVQSGNRTFGDWSMTTSDLDSVAPQEAAPLKEVLRLLCRRFSTLAACLPRLTNDVLLSTAALQPGARAECLLVAFAVLQPKGRTPEAPLLQSLAGLLWCGGEILGFLGPHLVGYAFYADREVVLDEVAELCRTAGAHVGVCTGPMLLLNACTDPADSELAFYGDLFARAQRLCDEAAKADVHIVMEARCRLPSPSVIWTQEGDLAMGRVDSCSYLG